MENVLQSVKKFVFIPLAMNQTLFYKKVADQLKEQGIESTFICIHERSHVELSKEGYDSYNFYQHGNRNLNLQQMEEQFAVHDPYLIVSHEKETYWINDNQTLFGKLSHALTSFEEIFNKIKSKGNEFVIVQELGGFISVQSSLFVSKKLGLENYFIEPSFFRKRFFLNKDSIAARKVNYADLKMNEEVSKYLDQTLNKSQIVIPTKDRLHYRGTLAKLVNVWNFKRFFEKLYDKYILGYQEEFGYVYVHFLKHFKSVLNNIALKKYYYNLSEIKSEFYYFPLHVPADVALTIRAPKYLDQLTLIEYLAKSCPPNVHFVIKEHPAMRGAIPAKKITDVIDKNQNIKILSPSENNFDVMKKSSCIFTINSKAGAEGILLKKKVICLGDSFYSGHPDVLASREAFHNDYGIKNNKTDQINTESMFQSIWEESLPGDLYNLESDNVKEFSQSLSNYLG